MIKKHAAKKEERREDDIATIFIHTKDHFATHDTLCRGGIIRSSSLIRRSIDT